MLADITFSAEGVAVIGVLLTALSGTVAYLFKLSIKTKDEQLAIYKKLSDEAIAVAEIAAIRERRRRGLAPHDKKAPVVPEHDSPVTPEQQETADAASQRARLVRARLELGFNAREVDEAGKDAPIEEVEQPPAIHPEVVQEIVEAVVQEVVRKTTEVIPEKTADAVVEKLDCREKKGGAP